MPRNGSGSMTTPGTYPPAAGSTISLADFKALVDDIVAELTDSLSRSGKGSMSAPLALPEGTPSAPSVAFSAEPNTGLYKPVGVSELRAAVLGALIAKFTAAGVAVEGWISATGTISAGAPSALSHVVRKMELDAEATARANADAAEVTARTNAINAEATARANADAAEATARVNGLADEATARLNADALKLDASRIFGGVGLVSSGALTVSDPRIHAGSIVVGTALSGAANVYVTVQAVAEGSFTLKASSNVNVYWLVFT